MSWSESSGSSGKKRAGSSSDDLGLGLPGTAGLPSAHKPERGRGPKAVVAAILVVVLVIFVLRNSGRVPLDFIIVSAHPRMIWLIIGCVLVGVGVGYYLGRPRKAKAKKPPA